MVRYNLSFAGAGRVAGALCMKMHHSGIKILQVVSETETYGKPLAGSCNAEWSEVLNFHDTNNIIIVAVPDHRLKEVIKSIRCHESTIVAHTAGSYGLEVFPSSVKRKGVFYPLQTFTKGRNITFRDLPFILEASDTGTGEMLKKLAESIGGKTWFIDHERRKKLHLAAVFVNNFINHMLAAGKELASQDRLPFDILEPLIMETISKALENGPENSQTGPAVRNDVDTIEKHLNLLSFSPELQNVYREVTLSIMKSNNLSDND
ncbi:MAG: DUF2520 domain-containing protein [Bacteroidales bacterium]|jgi:predicted short-subunit dehydrogenase-like oxidoreductase (DUF2520 family)|nr:DUF2520 domain-containing protein [Bacteroidales bacterium]